MAVMDESECSVQIRAAKAKTSWIKFFVVGLLNRGIVQADDGISRKPAVVAVNRHSKERRLLKYESNDEAEQAVERVRADLDILGIRQWCDKYDVPLVVCEGIGDLSPAKRA